ncbi:MAG: transcriptional regulator [Rhizobiales bacterium 12-68-15]|nr:MAG: transcriptional regulator [Rhizobiales bacterium 12-68-15]
MQIGDLSRQTGVNIETIRYYERVGVLPKPARQSNGRRSYSPADAERLGFIRHARDLGFDLPNVRVLLALQEQPEASCDDASRLAQEQLEAVESRIARLLKLRDELRRMVGECGRGRVAECRVIEALTIPQWQFKLARSKSRQPQRSPALPKQLSRKS